MPGTRKLGKTTDQRKAMLRQQVTDFLGNGRMETTYTRCKEIAPMAEKMITLGKKKDLAAYRQALSFITREDVAKKVFLFVMNVDLLAFDHKAIIGNGLDLQIVVERGDPLQLILTLFI